MAFPHSTRHFIAGAPTTTALFLVLGLELAGLSSCMDADDMNEGLASEGDDLPDAGEDLACTLQLAIEGAFDLSTSSTDIVVCLGSGNDAASAHVGFAIWPDGRTPAWAFKIELHELDAGALGEHPALVQVGPRVDFLWETDSCFVDVTQYELVERDRSMEAWYRLAGRGHCSGPALPRAGADDGEIQIGSFEFDAMIPWRG